MNLQLSGKRALVTGGSRGIGKAVAHALASEGVRVVICSRNLEEITKAATELSKSTSSDVYGVHADMGNHLSIKALLLETIANLGGLDILVNNAARVSGGPTPDSLLEGNDELLRYDFETKMLGYVRAAREAAPQMMKNRWGRIINISSPGSTKVLNNYFSIGVSKAALESITRYMAFDLAHKGINVNSISSSLVETDAIKHFPNQSEIKEILSRRNPKQKKLITEDIAKAAVMLCTEESEMIVGQNILVDGGDTLLLR